MVEIGGTRKDGPSADVLLRACDVERDREAIHRIWHETGWAEPGKEDALDAFLTAGRGWVAEMDGDAESLAVTVEGVMRYLDADLPLCCVGAVTTGRVARKQGLAARLTARAIAADAADGAAVSALGMFEQGYYNRLGFGTGGYEHIVSLDPAHLRPQLRASTRPARRLTCDDWEAVHASRLARRRDHGACNLAPAAVTRAEMLEHGRAFGLGYADGAGGAITHHLWCSVRGNAEAGPYTVDWMAWRTPGQFRELMELLRSFGDQVRLINLREPAGIQLQDLMDRPFARFRISERSAFETRMRAFAFWQARICDLRRCLELTVVPGGDVRFNLHLSDPIGAYLAGDAPWRGTAGDFVVTLGPSSGAEPGTDASLPTLEASVGAFTRLWLGVRPASGLAITDDLRAPPELLEALDHLLRLPPPHPDWDF